MRWNDKYELDIDWMLKFEKFGYEELKPPGRSNHSCAGGLERTYEELKPTEQPPARCPLSV